MCKCKFFNGDSCSYEDRASGQTEDGYCEFESVRNVNKITCDTFTEGEYDEDEDE